MEGFTAQIEGKSRIAEALMEKIRSSVAVEEEEVNQIVTTVDILKIKRRMAIQAVTRESLEELPADKIVKTIDCLTDLIVKIQNEEDKDKNKLPTLTKINDKLDATERKRIKETVARLNSGNAGGSD